MRRSLVIILAMLFCLLEGYSREADSIYANVSQAYQKLLKEHSASAEIGYFRAFPDNAYEFVAWEIHSSKNNEDIYKYVQMLGKLTSVKDTLYCKKLINLSIGASLDADGLSYLHDLLHEKLKDDGLSGVFPVILSGMTKGEQLRFWMFYWSSLCFQEENGGKYVDKDADKELRLVLKRLGQRRTMKHIVRLAYKYSSHQIYFVSSYGLNE